ncbi:unnamed protein product [Effrenium voratum]|nr:unnamed protein product [Effrenium voratum]
MAQDEMGEDPFRRIRAEMEAAESERTVWMQQVSCTLQQAQELLQAKMSLREYVYM